jgi:hypothetical protein
MKTLEADAIAQRLKQRSDYTHKHNTKSGRHGWLRLTPAYSLKIVEELLADVQPSARVLDPFSGTATTPLAAAYRGHPATSTEINPFLVWLGRAKLERYTPTEVAAAREAAHRAAAAIMSGSIGPVPAPPIHNVERWWNANELRFLCELKAALGAQH